MGSRSPSRTSLAGRYRSLMCCSKGHGSSLEKILKISIFLKGPWNDKNVRHCSYLSGELVKWKWRFPKTLSKPEELKTPSYRWDVDQERFENAAFRKRWRQLSKRHSSDDVMIIMWSTLTLKAAPKGFCRPAIVAFSNFSGAVSTENLWFIFIVKRCYQISPTWCVKGVFAIFTSSWPRSLPEGYD